VISGPGTVAAAAGSRCDSAVRTPWAEPALGRPPRWHRGGHGPRVRRRGGRVLSPVSPWLSRARHWCPGRCLPASAAGPVRHEAGRRGGHRPGPALDEARAAVRRHRPAAEPGRRDRGGDQRDTTVAPAKHLVPWPARVPGKLAGH